MRSILRKLNLLLFVLVVYQAFMLFQAKPANAQTAAFLYRPYYGPYVGWNSTLDHKYPDYNVIPNNEFVRYTGASSAPNCTTADYCYNGHSGYDFALVYKPIVASALGDIEYAG